MAKKINPQIMALLRRMQKPAQPKPSPMTIAITIRMGGNSPVSVDTNQASQEKQYTELSWKPSPEGGNIGGYGD